MKIALLGVSHWHAQMHLDAGLSGGAEIVAAWDEDATKASAFAARHGLDAVESFEAAMGKADLVVLMGHPQFVPDRALAVIEAGVPMVLEKPAAVSTAALTPIRDLAVRKNAFVGVPLPNRFGPIFSEQARLGAQHRLGRLAHAHFRIVNGPPQRYRDDAVGWLLDPAVGGGGALRNLGIHGIDAALSLATGPLSIVSASVSAAMHNEQVEDHALVVLRDAQGALFTVEAGYTYASMAPGGDFEWRVVTANATLIDRGENAFCATLDDGALHALAPEHPSTRYQLFMADTIERLGRGEPPTITIQDYWAAMTLIDTAYQKAKQ